MADRILKWGNIVNEEIVPVYSIRWLNAYPACSRLIVPVPLNNSMKRLFEIRRYPKKWKHYTATSI